MCEQNNYSVNKFNQISKIWLMKNIAKFLQKKNYCILINN